MIYLLIDTCMCKMRKIYVYGIIYVIWCPREIQLGIFIAT